MGHSEKHHREEVGASVDILETRYEVAPKTAGGVYPAGRSCANPGYLDEANQVEDATEPEGCV